MNVIHNLGLGDHIIMAPYIKYLAVQHESINLACYPHNKESVKSFYINHPNINLVPDDYEGEWNIRLGYYGDNKQISNESFIDWFYRQTESDRSFFLEYSPLKEASKRVGQHIVPVEDFIFVHDDPERGFNITNINTKLRIIRPFKEGSILRYASLIEKAKEIHVIDSSFFHLCEALPTTGKLYYHQYARENSTNNYRFIKEWEVIK